MLGPQLECARIGGCCSPIVQSFFSYVEFTICMMDHDQARTKPISETLSSVELPYSVGSRKGLTPIAFRMMVLMLIKRPIQSGLAGTQGGVSFKNDISAQVSGAQGDRLRRR